MKLGKLTSVGSVLDYKKGKHPWVEKTKKEPVKWMGSIPERCAVCSMLMTSVFIDGKIQAHGCWALMCVRCHNVHGCGLGVGKGQMYSTETGLRIYPPQDMEEE